MNDCNSVSEATVARVMKKFEIIRDRKQREQRIKRPCSMCGKPACNESLIPDMPEECLCDHCQAICEERLARAIFGDTTVDRMKAKAKGETA